MKGIKDLLVVTSLMVMTLSGASGSWAQDKAKDAKAAPSGNVPANTKVILENDKVRILESRFAPGTGGPMMERPGRAAYSVLGGTFLRTYPDGKKVTVVTKTGEWRWLAQEKYSFINAGKTEIILNTVYLK
jgi:hypothetical protein